MFEYNEESITQNLKDAGCSQDLIDNFLEDWKGSREDVGMKRLAEHRRMTLAQIHREQKKIDCLDYFIYSMEKKTAI